MTLVSREHTIGKIYLSNFLTGLVFWYGIEKLFMRHIGITPIGIGIAGIAFYAVELLGDIPAGILADKWSRKGVLLLSALFLAMGCVVCGTSHGLLRYSIGYVLYGLYVICTSGTYQSLTYDVLYEQNRAGDYSKVMGRAYAIFLAGAGVANVASGFIVRFGNLQLPFFLSVVPCLVNLVVMASMHEPTFHKKEQAEQFLPQLGGSVRTMAASAVLRALTVVWCLFAVAAPFTQEFSQVYMLHYTTDPIWLGLLWAIAAFTWAAGSVVAHRARRWLGLAVLLSFGFLIALGFTTRVWGLALLFVQLAVGQVAFNLIETQVQDATPAAVRTSVMSVLSSLSRVVELPCIVLFGWLTARYGVFAMTRVIAVVSVVGVVYWLLAGGRRIKATTAAESLAIAEVVPKP